MQIFSNHSPSSKINIYPTVMHGKAAFSLEKESFNWVQWNRRNCLFLLGRFPLIMGEVVRLHPGRPSVMDTEMSFVRFLTVLCLVPLCSRRELFGVCINNLLPYADNIFSQMIGWVFSSPCLRDLVSYKNVVAASNSNLSLYFT